MENKKVYKSLNPSVSDEQLEQEGCYTVNYCTWNRLLPYLKMASGFSNISGVRFDKDGIEIIKGKQN